MKLKYFQQYWNTLKGTAMMAMPVTIKHSYGRIFWTGTVFDFCNLDLKKPFKGSGSDANSFEVVYFGHPAITEMDELNPVYNRPIIIEVI